MWSIVLGVFFTLLVFLFARKINKVKSSRKSASPQRRSRKAHASANATANAKSEEQLRMEAEARAARKAEEAAKLAKIEQARQLWREANPEKAALLTKYKNGLPFITNALREMFDYDRLDEIEPENCSWLHKKADFSFPETVRCFRELVDLIRSLDADFQNASPYGSTGYGYDFDEMYRLYRSRSVDATYLFVDKASEISFCSEAEESEISEILRQYNLHALVGRRALTDWPTGEQYWLEDKMVGYGMVDLAATYGGVWLIRKDS